MEILNKIDWDKMDGLIPVVTQDATTKEVLMLAYMDKEALELTLKTNIAHYFSRSKQRIWKKGESSGHIQEVVEALVDCDDDKRPPKVNLDAEIFVNFPTPPRAVYPLQQLVIEELTSWFTSQGVNLLLSYNCDIPAIVTVVNSSRIVSDIRRDLGRCTGK